MEIQAQGFGRRELGLSQHGAAWLPLPGCLASSGNSIQKYRLERLVLVLGAWKSQQGSVQAGLSCVRLQSEVF